MHDRILDVSKFLSQHLGAKFDMLHPLDVIVNFAQQAVNASLWDFVVNQVLFTRPTSLSGITICFANGDDHEAKSALVEGGVYMTTCFRAFVLPKLLLVGFPRV